MGKAREWPADKVERRDVRELVPYARNARTHTDEQIQQLADSISEWGWTMPVLVDENGGIIAGHGRVLAALKLEILDVPVMVAQGWTEKQKRAYVIADNKLALNADWDDDILRDEIDWLKTENQDISLTGFSYEEIEELFNPSDNAKKKRTFIHSQNTSTNLRANRTAARVIRAVQHRKIQAAYRTDRKRRHKRGHSAVS